jgi:hypothetical protein
MFSCSIRRMDCAAHGLCGAWIVRRLVCALIRLHGHPSTLSNPCRGTLVGERAIGWRNSDVNPYTAPGRFGVGLFARQDHLRGRWCAGIELFQCGGQVFCAARAAPSDLDCCIIATGGEAMMRYRHDDTSIAGAPSGRMLLRQPKTASREPRRCVRSTVMCTVHSYERASRPSS